jgi:hypothetical protein
MESNKKNLMIICGPNGVCFETYAKTMRIKDLLYHSNCDMLFWNYKGFGLNRGIPSYSNIQSDAEKIFEYVKKNNKWNKIGVYGLSMGGLPACHLAG